MSNTAAQQRRRRARKKAGITLPSPLPKYRPRALSTAAIRQRATRPRKAR
jgi:hypothetical protein